MAETALGSGLKQAADAPLLHPYAQLLGGWTQVGGAYGKAEVGAHLTTGLTAYADGGWQQDEGWNAGLGLRLEL